MRRLGDLNLESSESERIEHELATNEGLQGDRGDPSLLGPAQDLSQVRAQRLGALSAGARLRAQRAARQGAGDARPAGRELSEQPLHRRGAVPPRRDFVREQVLSGGAEPPTRRSSSSGPRRASTIRASTSTAGRCSSRARASGASSLSPACSIRCWSRRAIRRRWWSSTRLSKPNRELVEDTFRVMSITFSYLDGPKSIDEFVKHRKPRPYYYLLYARLGDLYIEKERYTDAADSYRAFVSQDRNNEKAPLLEMQAIEAYSKGGFPDLVLQGKKEFVENYSYGTPFWQGRTPKGEPKVVAELKTNLKDVAQYYHARGAAHQERGGLPGSGEVVPQLPDLVPGRSRIRGHQFPAGRARCTRASNTSRPRSSTRTPHIPTARTTKAAEAGYAALVAYGKEEEALVGRCQGEDSRQGSRQLPAIRAGLPDAPGGAAGADARGDRSVRRQGLSRAPPPPRRCCSRASRRWTPASSASPTR